MEMPSLRYSAALGTLFDDQPVLGFKAAYMDEKPVLVAMNISMTGPRVMQPQQIQNNTYAAFTTPIIVTPVMESAIAFTETRQCRAGEMFFRGDSAGFFVCKDPDRPHAGAGFNLANGERLQADEDSVVIRAWSVSLQNKAGRKRPLRTFPHF